MVNMLFVYNFPLFMLMGYSFAFATLYLYFSLLPIAYEDENIPISNS